MLFRSVGDYPVDHHHMRYTGADSLPDLHFYPVPSYGLPLGTLIPEKGEGLIVAEKSISVSNLVNGTTRLQPVVLQIGQAAGTLAAISVKENLPLTDVSVRAIQNVLMEHNGYLMPFLDVPANDKLFHVFQRIGVTGILQGEGRNEGWTNQTWLRPEDPLLGTELKGVKELYPNVNWQETNKQVTVSEALKLIGNIVNIEKITLSKPLSEIAKEIAAQYGLTVPEESSSISRGLFALWVDELLHPFEKDVDIFGNFK